MVAIFSKLFITLECLNCTKKVILDLSDKNIIKYGFVCPHCNIITKPDEMWEMVIKNKSYFFR